MKKQINNRLALIMVLLLALTMLILMCGCNTSDNTQTDPSVTMATMLDAPADNVGEDMNSTDPSDSQNSGGNIYLPGAENTNPDADNSVDSENVQSASDADETHPDYSYVELETIGDNEIDFNELP